MQSALRNPASQCQCIISFILYKNPQRLALLTAFSRLENCDSEKVNRLSSWKASPWHWNPPSFHYNTLKSILYFKSCWWWVEELGWHVFHWWVSLSWPWWKCCSPSASLWHFPSFVLEELNDTSSIYKSVYYGHDGNVVHLRASLQRFPSLVVYLKIRRQEETTCRWRPWKRKSWNFRNY